jgi:hypothetical protein
MRTKTIILAGLLFAFTPAMFADLLSVSPATQTVNLGNTATVTIDYSGGYVGDYDLDISWNATILSLASISYGSQLGGGSPNSIQNFPVAGAGTVNASEISLLTPAGLIALQPGQTASLLSLVFNTLSVGTSAVDISFNAIGDELGNALAPPLQQGSITVVQGGPNVIPEPSTIMLLTTAAGLIALRLRKRRA